MRIPTFSVFIIFLVISLLGIFFLPLLPLKLSPSKQLPQATISYSMTGSSSRVIESDVTSKIESMVNRIKGVNRVSSSSGNGWGRVYVSFDKFVDIDIVRFELAATIRQLWGQLPKGVSYPSLSMSNISSDTRAFMSFSINAYSAPNLIMDYVEKNIKPQLINIYGLDKVVVYGAAPMEWQLTFDADQLLNLEIELSSITTAIQQELKKEFLGITSTQNNNLIRVVLAPNIDKNPDWASIQIEGSNNRTFSLGQLAIIQRQEQAPTNYFRINGLNSIYMNLYAEETSNQIKLSTQIQNELAKINLPQNFEVHKLYDATEYIQNELDKIYFRSFLTLIILLLFVLIISRNWRYLLLISLSLVSNLSIALIFYYLLKIELQLYSLAGITISMTLIIDNAIVMADHLLHKHNFRAFPAIFAATMTTIAALSIIFFIDERLRLNLQDFAYVVIVNLIISLFIALFLVPALINRLHFNIKKRKKRRKRIIVKITQFYTKGLLFLIKYKRICIIVIILIFGLPVYLLPEKFEGEKVWHNLYNTTIGSDFYQKKLKEKLELVLGGTSRLFVKDVYEGSYFSENNQVDIRITANMPNGATIAQMNDLIKEIEIYLSGFKEIEQFQTDIQSAYRANISITFKKEYEQTGFPFSLRSMLISKVQELGSATWRVYLSGLGQDPGFHNMVRESAGSFQVIMHGYNYDDLIFYAENLKRTLMQNRRIREINIASEIAYYKDDYLEYEFIIDKESLIKENISIFDVYNTLKTRLAKNLYVDKVLYDNNYEEIKLSSLQSKIYDIWNLQNAILHIGNADTRLKQIAQIEKVAVPQKINREDRQYVLVLQYDYIGNHTQGQNFLNKTLETFQKKLPLGYNVGNNGYNGGWTSKDNKQYLYLAIIILIIIFICSILFNSIKQSLSIISIIPISYIGVFLTFYLFSINFDQGGFASLILLCGITVNASIYIINEMNNISVGNKKLGKLKVFKKAWNAKIFPIFLTTVSTILGFIPFIITTESFWFPLAAGTIGGLIFSWIGLIIYLPLILIKRKK